MSKIIGLTGGIGSGKTTVAKMFTELGVPVYIADDAGKKVLDLPKAVNALKQVFGEKVFTDGHPDRKKIAALVFGNPEKLSMLNRIVHPLVKNDFNLWLKENRQAPFIIKETAILFESGSDLGCDKIITVTAPLEDRISRVISRDQSDREAILKRIDSQWTDEQRTAKSDYIIENTNKENTKQQVVNIYQILKHL
ncbi:dephospho-CoA kinase [Flavobacterium pallidum]|uniref:Dephospho-CoA kinase n=1 Tax=Flavobacterium pallidum TaxID=2172098 RepID=A0A2S1SHV5_9FLAO|nr:dephospho-CoA kinase [Flavobacterium pallidum]AWI25965.1 dephospho-CoA kinase [Flavobacterium pallidum]